MCGRFTIQYTWAQYYEALNIIPASAKGRNDPQRYNVAPTQDVGFVARDAEGSVVVLCGRRWLVPFRTKEIQKYPVFNARSETRATKSSFRETFKTKRCLVPASSYYEWAKADDGGNDPQNIHLRDDEPISFAGLWAHNDHLAIASCTILTAAAASESSSLHHRMPIIPGPESHELWIDRETSVDQAQALLADNRGAERVIYRAARDVNASRASGAHLLSPLAG